MSTTSMALHRPRRVSTRLYYVSFAATLFCFATTAHAGLITESEPNDSISGAQNVDGSFTLDLDANIIDSTTIPHVSIKGTGNGTFDYYSFTISDIDDRAVFDIDFGEEAGSNATDFDSFLSLFDSSGNLIDSRDDGDTSDGASGSTSTLDTYFERGTWPSTGVFAIRVSAIDGVGDEVEVPSGATYTLQISVENHATPVAAIPEPRVATLLCLVSVTSLVCSWRRYRRHFLLQPTN